VFDDAEESDAVFEEYSGLLSKFVADSNVNAQVTRGASLVYLLAPSACGRSVWLELWWCYSKYLARACYSRLSSNGIDVRLLPDLQDKGIEACCSFAKKAPAALVKQAAGEFVGSCLCSSMSFLPYH